MALRIGLLVLLTLEYGCLPKLAARHKSEAVSTLDVATTDAGGATTATLSASSGAPQRIKASSSGSLKGSSVTFPPGTLSVDTAVTVQEGEPLANDASATALGLSPSDLTSGSTPTLITPAQQTDPKGPFTVDLAVTSGAALDLAAQPQAQLVVLYKEISYATGKTTIGLIVNAKLSPEGKTVTFDAPGFGVYQVAYSKQAVAVTRTAPSDVPPLAKAGAGVTLVIAFASTNPASPANATSFKVIGTAANADTVGLYGDAACTTALAAGPATDFQGAGIAVPVPADKSVDVFGKATSKAAAPSACTHLTTLVSDTQAPAAPVVSSSSDLWATKRPTWTWGTPTGASGVFRTHLDAAVTDADQGASGTSFTPTSDLSDGDHTLFVQAKDLAGNWSASGSYKVTIDTTPPAMAITAPTENLLVYTKAVTVTGTCETGLVVNVTPGTGMTVPAVATACTAGAFSFSITHDDPFGLSEAMTVKVAQTDQAGNTTTVTRNWRYGLDSHLMRVWLDAGDPTTLGFAAGAGHLNLWKDKSPVGATVSPNGGITQTVAATTTNLKTLDFDGTGYAQVPAASSRVGSDLDPSQDGFSLFVVLSTGSTAPSTLLAKAAAKTEYEIDLNATSGSATGSVDTATTSSVATAITDGKLHVLSVVNDLTAQKLFIYRDTDATAGTTGALTLTSPITAAVPLTVGGRSFSSSLVNGYTGSIGEVVIYGRTMSDAERLEVIGYLKGKWGF